MGRSSRSRSDDRNRKRRKTSSPDASRSRSGGRKSHSGGHRSRSGSARRSVRSRSQSRRRSWSQNSDVSDKKASRSKSAERQQKSAKKKEKRRIYRKRRRVKSTRIEIGRLTPAVTKEHILEIFSAYGPIKSLDVTSEPRPSLSTGSRAFHVATVQFESSSDAARARKYTNGGMIDRQEITVDLVPDKSPKRRN